MYLRKCNRAKDGKRHAYWALVESYRTERGPRQRVVAYLGSLDEAGRLGVKAAAGGAVDRDDGLFEGSVQPRWVEVDAARMRVERVRDFGGPWLGLQLARQLDLVEFLQSVMPAGREEVPRPLMSLVLVLGRLLDPSSELRLAEHIYEHTAMSDVLGVPARQVNDDRLYRALDALLPHKDALQQHLKARLGELFELKYDLLLYDVTSTHFEGLCEGNAQARRGYSRDHRPDCKQVCIALVVSRCGMPLGYEVFAGNRNDVTTVQEIVQQMESRYGQADRVWVMDRGMVSRRNVRFLNEGGRRYILGTSKSELKKYERDLLEDDWTKAHEGLEVKRVSSPDVCGTETFILCRSADRREKERAMHTRFVRRIEDGLTAIGRSCEQRRQDPLRIAQRVGRLLGANTRGAGAFEIDVQTQTDGSAKLLWRQRASWRDWATLSEGCYLLRTNIRDWPPEELWRAYMQLTQAEAAFRVHKSDLQLRPIWHQKEHRVQAHILVCFLAYVLWKTLGQMCQRAGLGDEPRKVLDELSRIKVVDVSVPTRGGPVLRQRLISRPTDHQNILLHHLNLSPPSGPPSTVCSEDF